MIKLIKHELSALLPDFLGFYLVFIIFSGLAPLYTFGVLRSNLNNNQLSLILGFGIGLIIVGTFLAILISTFTAVLNLFSKKLFGPQGYLSFTLPLTTRALMASKLITGFTLLSLSGLVFSLGLSFALVSALLVEGVRWQDVLDGWTLLRASGGLELLRIVSLALTPLMISAFVNAMTLLLLVMSFTHTSFVRKRRVLVGLVLFAGVNIAMGWITQGIGFEFIVGPQQLETFVEVNQFTINWPTVLLQTSFNLGLAVAFFELNRFLLDRKLELE